MGYNEIMTSERLDKSVIDTDHRLTREAEQASKSLAFHRWHWTLNENNPRRVTLKAYAREIGIGETTVRMYAHAWEIRHADPSVPMSDALERAKLGEDAYTAAEAIAESRGTSVATVRRSQYGEVRHVRDVARDRAERHGTSVVEEVREVVRQRRESAERTQAQQRERASRTTMRADVAASRLVTARRNVLDAVEQLIGVDLEEDDVEHLNDRLDKLEAAVGLMRARTRGESGVDWDAELRGLLEVG